MVNLTTFMVMATAMLLGVNALDKVTADKIKQELVKAKIIPDAIEEFEPLTKLKITYDEHNDLENGEHLKPEETLVAPSIWFDAPKKDTEYTLAMVNLDSNGPMIRHWIATNVKGGDEKGTAFLSQLPNRQYTSYKGPTPPSGSTNHRVAFILFEQEALNQTFVPEIDGSTTRNRAFFNLTQFAQENKLKPVSAAYFYTDYQEGFSQQYPPVDDDISEEIHEAGLVHDILDDVGNILDLDGILGITIGIGNNDNNDDEKGSTKGGTGEDKDDIKNPVQIKPSKPSTSVDPDTTPKPTTKPKKGGLLHGILDDVQDLLHDILGKDDDDDDDDDRIPSKNKPKHVGDDDDDDDEDGINIDLNILRAASASPSVSASALASRPSADIKQAGLLGDLLNGLDDILDIDLNIGHHDDDDDRRPPRRRPNNRHDDDDDEDDEDSININLDLLRLGSASASAMAAKPSTDLKQAGLLDGLLDDLGNILDIDINIGDDDDDDYKKPPRKAPKDGNDNDDDDGINIDLNLARAASASVSATAATAKSSGGLKPAGLLNNILDDLNLDVQLHVGDTDNDFDDHRRGNSRANSNDDIVVVKVESNLNRPYPPLLAAHASQSATASVARPSAELKQAGILDNLVDSIGYLLGKHRDVEDDIVSGDLVIENDANSIQVAIALPSSSVEVVDLTDDLLAELRNGVYDVRIDAENHGFIENDAALQSLVVGARYVSVASIENEEVIQSAMAASV